MTEFRLYKLDFISPFTKLDSIKIAGAVISRAVELYSDTSGTLLECFRSGKIIFSNPLPLKENNPLLPFPKIPIKFRDTKNMDFRKKIKNYLSIETLKMVVENFKENGFLIYEDFSDILKEEVTEEEMNSFDDEIGVKIYKTPEPRDDKLIFTDVFTKEYESKGLLTIDNNGNKSGMNFWIVVQLENECSEVVNMLNTSLELLSDIGISGRKSVGRGQFTLEKYYLTEKFGFNGEGYYYLLSKFIPNQNEIQKIDLERSTYSFDIFSGLNEKGSNLGIYRYFVPGSILYLRENVYGKTVVLDKYERIIPFTGVFLKVG